MPARSATLAAALLLLLSGFAWAQGASRFDGLNGAVTLKAILDRAPE